MARLIHIRRRSDKRGELFFLEDYELGFRFKRCFLIYPESQSTRGNHALKRSYTCLICIKGSCQITVQNEAGEETFELSDPNTCLHLEPSDWRTMSNFSANCMLMALSSEYYDESDYVYKLQEEQKA